MEFSKYNICRDTEDGMYIINLISEAIVKVNEKDAKKIKSNDFNAIEEKDIDFLLDRYILIKGQNDDIKTLMLRYDNYKYADDSIYCTLIPTYSCNFSCNYCYQSALCVDQEPNFNILEWLDNLLVFFQGATINKKNLHIEWFGGEPTLFAKEIIEFNHKLRGICDNNECQFSSSMISNGYLLSNEVFDRLYYSGVTSYLITIDGLKDTHNRRRF